MNYLLKIKNFIKYRLLPVHNMHKHAAEQFYFEEYAKHVLPMLKQGQSLLDIGCQYGRFTIPAAFSGMKVIATDLHEKYFKYIRKNLKGHDIFFRREDIDTSLRTLAEESFDVVLCLELLYNLPDPAEKIKKLGQLVKPDGILISSHRTTGYYVYRYIRERNFQALQQIIEGTHSEYNAQNEDELVELYSAAGLNISEIIPIGMFSGFGSDPFSGIANPKKLNSEDKTELNRLETDPYLITQFSQNARYWLVISQHK